MIKKLILLVTYIITALSSVHVVAVGVPITSFPMDKYNQDINHWVKPSDPDYDEPLIDFADQQKYLKEYYKHYYATGVRSISPWGNKYVNKALNNISAYVIKQNIIDSYSKGYAENFRHYHQKWLENIIENINLKQFKLPLKYNFRNRGIAVRNLLARGLPTNDPYFYPFTKPGNGYPFDMLQESAVWVGTPVYIIGETLDHQWYLVLTPSFTSWVERDGIAKTSKSFITKWQKHARNKMVAITKTNVTILDNENQYRFNTYIGAIFPGVKNYKNSISILIPTANNHHHAQIAYAKVSKNNATLIPLPATPHNFVSILSSLLGRPYGWGNMYFYNDCSAELQSFYTPFGIWLPRNSSAQIKSREFIDLSSLDRKNRIKYLQKYGEKFTTLIYIDGHIMVYLGNYPNPNTYTDNPMAMTYQNIWGLKPQDNSYRAVIGQSALLPLLETYPEDSELDSQANKKHFKILYLNKHNNSDYGCQT